MKILFISNLYPPNVVGGYERLCHEVACAFAARGHEVCVLTSTYGGLQQDYPRLNIYRSLVLLANRRDIYAPFEASAAEREAINLANVAAFHSVLAHEQPDVVFAWNLFFFDPSLLSALQDCDRRVVTMLTDNWLLVMLDGGFMADFFAHSVFGSRPFPSSKAKGLAAFLRRPSPAPARRFPLKLDAVFGSRFMSDLYAAAGVGFASQRVIHNGVRSPVPPDAVFAARTTWVTPGEVRLLFAGRLVDLKGAHTIVEAMPALREALRDRGLRLRLTVVGDSQDQAYFARFSTLVEASGCANLIQVIPPVAEGALFELFQQHDLYLFPSLYEPFSLTLIIALAAGIPTVASMAGGNPEIVIHGRTGMLFEKGNPRDLADAVTVLVDRPELRDRLSRGGRREAEGFAFEHMVSGMERYLCRER